MLGDDEHPISFLFEPRVEGAHVKVVVRSGLRGMRAFTGELTFRPEEWIAFREAIGQSRVADDAAPLPLVGDWVPQDLRPAAKRLALLSTAVGAVLSSQLRVVHLDATPIEIEHEQ